MSDNHLTRREWLAALTMLSSSYVVSGFSRTDEDGPPKGGHYERTGLDIDSLKNSRSRVVPVDAGADVRGLDVSRTWIDSNRYCRSVVTNRGRMAARVKEVVLFDVETGLAPETTLYGEGFQMLSQTGGTVGASLDYSQYTDPKHYKLPDRSGSRTVYGLLTLTPPGADTRMLAFTSCRRFSGLMRVAVRTAAIEVVVDTEGLSLAPGETWELEEFTFRSGSNRDAMLADLADRLVANHGSLVARGFQPRDRGPERAAPRVFSAPPTGWCSWYCFGPRVTAQQVLDNLDTIASKIPGLTYVQIDDGYQPAMGDWLETGAAFGGKVQSVLAEIRTRGFQPAIWVAPFVAEAESHVFQQHPDWFVKEADSDAPLRSDKVTFGGWRRGPWYVLDGTHPEVQRHFEQVFRTMRQEWGCSYFKLDANFWGAIHGGRFHDPRATRIDAYRRGMQAVRGGAGDSFILGCNHPIWPSIGLVHGSRSSNDIKRDWGRVSTTARQNLSRNWQNARLWWNDPDAIVLTGDLTDDEFMFHATAIYATGGMLLSGDDLTVMPAARMEMLKKLLLPPTGLAARFESDALDVGVVTLPRGRAVCLFNWLDEPRSFRVRLGTTKVVPYDRVTVRDFWSGESLGRHERELTIANVPRHGARLLILEEA